MIYLATYPLEQKHVLKTDTQLLPKRRHTIFVYLFGSLHKKYGRF